MNQQNRSIDPSRPIVPTEHWSGQFGFLLATIGAAVGIGSIWKFPYEVGAHGGAGFVVFYLLGITLIVMPLMLAEMVIGRRGGADPATSVARVARQFGAARYWPVIGVLGVFTGFLILSYYCVIGGWALGYALETLRDGLPGRNAAAVQAHYADFLAAPGAMIGYHAAFVIIGGVFVARGVSGGIEIAAKILMPLLLALLVVLAGYSVMVGDLVTTLHFLFSFDASRLSARTAIEALGLGFFSIGVGLGQMITYAAYAQPSINLIRIGTLSVAVDTSISLLAGFAVFPIVFSHGLDPAGGPGLVFVSIPLSFADLPLGRAGAVAFFTLLLVAALGSAISTLELVVGALMRWSGAARRITAATTSGCCFLAGIPTVWSFNRWADFHPLASIDWLAGATVFDLLDGLASNVLLPLGGLAMAMFAGWALPDRLLSDTLALSPRPAALLRWLLRYLVPLAIIAIAAQAAFG